METAHTKAQNTALGHNIASPDSSHRRSPVRKACACSTELIYQKLSYPLSHHLATGHRSHALVHASCVALFAIRSCIDGGLVQKSPQVLTAALFPRRYDSVIRAPFTSLIVRYEGSSIQAGIMSSMTCGRWSGRTKSMLTH